MRRRRSPEQIKHLLAEQSSSGQSIAVYCRSHGINTGTFYAWRAKYAASKETVSAAGGFTRLVTTLSAAAARGKVTRATKVVSIRATPSCLAHYPSGALRFTNARKHAP